MQTSIISLALAGIFLVACNALPAVRDVSPQMEYTVKSAGSSLDTYLTAGFTRQARRLRNTPVSLQLGDLFFHLDENTGVELKSVHLPTLPVLTAQSIKTDLEYLNAKVQLEAESVSFVASYEVINNKFVSILPLTSTGEITVTFKTVKISGVVGLSITDDIFQATNLDLQYDPNEVTIDVSYYEDGEKISSQATVDSIDKSLVSKVALEMRYRMNDIIRSQLNILLNQQSLDHLFLGNSRLVADYRDHAARLSINANTIIDQLLNQADNALKALGVDPIDFPDIYESFSKKILIVRWHGSFTANKGGINGLASLRRYKDVSLSIEDGVVTIFGGIGFEKLSIGYSYYRAEFMGFGPTGTFRVGVEDPSIFMKLSVKLGFLTASLEDFKFEHAGHFTVDITGLDALKWLLQKIGEWVSAALRDLMSGGLEQKIKDIIDKIVNDFDFKPFFPPKMIHH